MSPLIQISPQNGADGQTNEKRRREQEDIERKEKTRERAERKKKKKTGFRWSTVIDSSKVKARHMRKHSTAKTGKTPDQRELEAHSFASF